MKKMLLAVVVIIIIAAIAAGFYKYRQPHKSAENKTTEVTLTATQLYNAFKNNEAEANKLYLDKVIQVTGRVDQVIPSQQYVVIVLSSGDMLGGISCKFSNKDVANKVQTGSTIAIKGICSGYLSDVNLIDCVLIDHS